MYLFDKWMMVILAIFEILAMSLATVNTDFHIAFLAIDLAPQWSVLGSEPPHNYEGFTCCYSAIYNAWSVRILLRSQSLI
jgi:hypothetical protein